MSAQEPPANRDPVAAFDVDPDPPTAGQPATLDAGASTDPDGDPLSYAWDLDDDGHADATGEAVQHTFAAAGDADVVLTVTDGRGGSDVLRRTITVNAPPTAAIEVTAPDEPHVDRVWAFDASGSRDPEAGVLTYAWTFGDGSSGSGQQVEHAFDAPGTYQVTLTVSDEAGGTGEATAQVVVENRAPAASLTVTPAEPIAGQDVTFDASASADPDGQPLSYAWDVDGDGEVDATSDEPTYVTAYTRNTVGREPFAATVTVSDGELQATSAPVQVPVRNAAPTAAFSIAPAQNVTTATEVTFDASASSDVEDGPLTYRWKLGDGTTATGVTATHRYTAEGTYTATLTVTDGDGGSATVTRQVPVANAPPVIVVLPVDPQGRPGETITLDASGSFDPDGTALTFAWQAPGHPAADGPVTSVSYPDEGLYDVALTVTDEDGAQARATITVKVDDDLVFRISGPDRIQTGVALSRRAFDQATQAVLARADDFPDALSASALAAQIDGPILLTSPDELSAPVADELQRLDVTHVYLAGGPAALKPALETALEERGITWTRLAGENRYETAAAVARELVRLGGPVQEAIVSLGAHADPSRAFPDALVAGNLAMRVRAPVLLTAGNALPPATRDVLAEVLAGSRVWVTGGEAAIGRSVETSLEREGYDVRRLAGPDRYATAVVVTDEARRRGAGIEPVVLASGRNFPDALAATVTAWKLGGVLMLVDPVDLWRSDATYAWLREHREEVDTVLLAGGPVAISDHTRGQVEDRIQDGRADGRRAVATDEARVDEARVDEGWEPLAPGIGLEIGRDHLASGNVAGRAFRAATHLHGPRGYLQGGLCAGALLAVARRLDPIGAPPTSVDVTLHAPTPLGQRLGVVDHDDGAGGHTLELLSGDTTTVSGTVDLAGHEVGPRAYDLASLAEVVLPEPEPQHLLPLCWVCGPDNPRGQRIAPAWDPGGRFVAQWYADDQVDDGSGRIDPVALAAVLDCPTAWVNREHWRATGKPAVLLASYHVTFFGDAATYEPLRIVAIADEPDGRKLHGRSAVLDENGAIVATAAALWIAVDALPEPDTAAPA